VILGGNRTRDLAHVGERSHHVLRTGSRRLYSKAQRRIIEMRLFGGQIRNLDVVPTGSWAVCKTIQQSLGSDVALLNRKM
jgi:hypothetical protein